ncbi:hypothetical protein BUALT_Bualt01G0237200 [Buddleja alternifolia]|uniref:Uncharacterized protein n=1 Tax=Buddleja alternifolia TaxID=168488 RepID=A0AAV6YG38_9LAMI|nr:hypothetical protein BUALT_Bualt01G0237200 [Buddleja alternifolia]
MKMKTIQESIDEEEALKIWDCGSPLYDSYELVALSHVVERHFMVLPYLSGSRKVADHRHEVCYNLKSSPDEEATGATNARRSSMLSFFIGKRKNDGERKEKAKKHKISGISKIFFQCRRK